MKRRMMSLIMCFLLVISMTTQVFASTNASTGEITASIVDGSTKVYSDATFFMNGEASTSTISVEDAIITLGVESVTLAVQIQNNTTVFTGKVYSIDGNGYYDNRMAVGDFAPANGYNIVSFKIVNGISELQRFPGVEILIEEITTGALVEMKFAIGEDDFARVLNLAKGTTALEKQAYAEAEKDSKEVDEKILQLLVNSKQFITEKNILAETNITSSEYTSTATYFSANTSKSVLQSFTTLLNANDELTVNDTVDAIISQTGFKYNYGTISSTSGEVGYFYILHGIVNSSTENLVSFSWGIVDHAQASNRQEISAEVSISESCTFSYNPSSNTARLMYVDLGPKMKNLTVAIELLGDTTCLYTATKVGTIEQDGSREMIGALASDLGIPSAIWAAISNPADNRVVESDTILFGSSGGQVAKYGDEIMAAAHKLSATSYIRSKGTSVGIIGVYHIENGLYLSSFRSAYRFKLESNLA